MRMIHGNLSIIFANICSYNNAFIYELWWEVYAYTAWFNATLKHERLVTFALYEEDEWMK